MSSSELKKSVVEQIIIKLEAELAHFEIAAKSAHEAATGDESKPEDQYDTRGLEASYLASAQAQRAAEIQALITQFKFMNLKSFTEKDAVDAGALVELKFNNKNSYYFLVPQSGGVHVQVENKNIQVISPKSPLGDALLGRWIGDTIEVETQNISREYEIVSVY